MAKLTFNNGPDASGASGSQQGDAAHAKASSAVPGQSEAQSARAAGKGRVAGGARVPGQDQSPAPSLYKDQAQDRSADPNYGYSRIRFHKKDEVNPYADQEDERHAMDSRMRTVLALAVGLLAVFVLSATLPTEIFNANMRTNNSLATILRDFTQQLHGFLGFLTGQETMYTTYVWEIVAAGIAGAALGVSGGVYQGAMKNALASPSTLGVTQGGALGLIIYGVFVYRGDYIGSVDDYSAMLEQMGPVEYVLETFGGFICSFAGCLIIISLIMLIATIAGRGRVTNVSLVIAGQVFSTVIGVIIAWIRYYLTEYVGDPAMVELVANAQTASFTGAYTATTVAVFAVPTLVCMGVVFGMSSRLSLLAFNDDEARSMGISTRFTRNVMVGLCTALTALVVSFAGMIGFVGFLVPHIARHMVGPDFRYLLPATALLGAMLVVAVHYVSYMGIPGFVVGSTGVFTSILGCIVFVVMALRSRGSKNAEWY